MDALQEAVTAGDARYPDIIYLNYTFCALHVVRRTCNKYKFASLTSSPFSSHTHTHSQLKRLLQGASYDVVNTPLDEEGTTLLHLGANSDNTTSLCILLDHGANINWQNADGFTALHVAAIWGRGEAVRLLLEEGADPTICDEDKLLPVDHARSEGEVIH